MSIQSKREREAPTKVGQAQEAGADFWRDILTYHGGLLYRASRADLSGVGVIGYHYTSGSCWASIQENGLVPYVLPAHVRRPMPKNIRPKRGIFVWTRELTPLEHAGSLFYQAHKKRTNYVAVLSVEYDVADCECGRKKNVFSLKHWFPEETNVDEPPFWHIGVPATLLFRVIPKERVKLLDLVDLSWRLRLERPDKYVSYPAYDPIVTKGVISDGKED